MILRAVLVCGMALFAYLVYLPGIGGALYYDDYSNLNALLALAAGGGIGEFVLSGNAGPLGRPIALLSFVPHAAGWPENASSILHVNVMIHVANMLLLFGITRIVLNLFSPSEDSRNFRIAACAALMWALMPLLVSTSLIAIQRMTGLATFFGLLGLLGFVWGYLFAAAAPFKALLIQLGALGLGSLLAVFSKESGALIPVFALVIELTLLGKVAYDIRYRRALRGVLLLCLAVPLYHISPLNRNWFHFNEFRGFSAWERLQSQWVFLWEYLFRGFFPRAPTSFGPFQDHYGLVTNLTSVFGALVAWLAMLAIAFRLRPAFPWLLFALLWFFAGHLLESTTVMLELVFEHRNYLAVYGFCLMLCWLGWNVQGMLRRVAPALLMTYIAMLGIITLSMTVLWGNPVEAANTWAEKNPRSARAALHAAFVELAGQGKDSAQATEGLLQHQGMARAMFILDRTSRVCPSCLDVKMQALAYSCQVTPPEDTRERFADIAGLARTGEVTIPVVDAFFPLHELVTLNACPPLTYDDLLGLAESVIANPKSDITAFIIRLHFVAAMNAQSLGADDKVVSHLAAAERVNARALPILQFQVHYLVENGRLDEAQAAIERRRAAYTRSGSAAHIEALEDLSGVVRLASESAG